LTVEIGLSHFLDSHQVQYPRNTGFSHFMDILFRYWVWRNRHAGVGYLGNLERLFEAAVKYLTIAVYDPNFVVTILFDIKFG